MIPKDGVCVSDGVSTREIANTAKTASFLPVSIWSATDGDQSAADATLDRNWFASLARIS
jgi:hypothetical protein